MIDSKKKVAIILAAGKSVRFGDIDKMLYQIDSQAVVTMSVRTFFESNLFDQIVVVANESNFNKILQLMINISKEIAVIRGGDRRQDSVKSALNFLGDTYDHLAIHDGARPFVSELMIHKGLELLKDFDCAIPGYPITDTIKLVEDEIVIKNIDRQKLFLVQTPQFFLYKKLFLAYQNFENEVTDDASLFEYFGYTVTVFQGEKMNWKLTNESDLGIFEKFYDMKFEK